jgi:putative transposase
MRAIASERRRFGYRRVGLMLERKGIEMHHKKLQRLQSQNQTDDVPACPVRNR